ncbi:MAG: GGDEF domain-containing protein, partial [Chloroflexota bacterium]
RNIRVVDLLCRYGGEEFAILLPETTLSRGRLLAERLRLLIAEEPVMVEDSAIQVTASLGVAKSTGGTIELADLVDSADQALYQAKRNGRNRVEVQAEE